MTGSAGRAVFPARNETDMAGLNKLEKAKNGGKSAAKKAANSPWTARLIRLGYAVRGLLYLLMGVLAVEVALGAGGQLTDKQGAIAAVGSQPFGKILLVIIAVGLAGYSIWGFIRAFLDPLDKGHDASGLITRVGFALTGISYALLLLPTLRLLFNLSAGASGKGSQAAAGSILGRPWGPWLIGAVGLVVIGVGTAQMIQGVKAKFDMRFDPYALDARQRRWATRLGRFGTIARGLVFGIIGFFLFQAALFADPNRVMGVDGALRELSHQIYGAILLGVVAAGLAAYGVYSLLGAAWFRLKTT